MIPLTEIKNYFIMKNIIIKNKLDFGFNFRLQLTWNMLAPYGVLHPFKRLSLPVETNHLPHVANFRLKTQLSCR